MNKIPNMLKIRPSWPYMIIPIFGIKLAGINIRSHQPDLFMSCRRLTNIEIVIMRVNILYIDEITLIKLSAKASFPEAHHAYK